ncbi:MAG: CocE/NonD family hydrolase [Cyanobacteria bacterium K_DeepCast_35m_m2_023]|nr:CocE/NonD family hydrolase [Cyanobacteria bacterium K_DeepCast_35m_m2_023]
MIARVWRPARQGCWPVLLMRQPYGRAIASTPVYAHPSWYARQGFVVVVQDVRGSGDSGGTFAGFAQEAQDSAQTVLWARSLPGSNGRVGTYGFSYQGLTQLLNHDPQGRPEALPDALAPAMCGLDERLHWCSSGGAHWWALSLAWGLQLAALQCRRRGDGNAWHSIRRSVLTGTDLEDGMALLARHDPSNMVLAWLRRDPSTDVGWTRHNVDPALWRRPLLLIGGWHDPHLEGLLDLDARARAAGGSPWLRIGAWSHLNWRGGLDALQLAFFRRQLALPSEPEPEPAPEPVAWQCITSRTWLTASPANASAAGCTWGLRSSGLANLRSDDGQLSVGGRGCGQVVLVHDPWRPAPGLGGHLAVPGGPCERSDLDQRSDVACWTSEPLDADLLLQGRPSLRITVAADQPGFDLVASLAAVSTDGRALQLSMGVVRVIGPQALQPQRCQVVMQPLLARLERGQRLRLSLAASAWPLVAVNPGDGSLPLGGAAIDHRVITLNLHLDEAALRIDFLPFQITGANCAQIESTP